MIWHDCFSKKCVGKLVKIDGRMTDINYYNILNNNLLQQKKCAWDRLSSSNDPKHTFKVASKFFTKKKIEKLECPQQSPDINPTENL